MLCKGPIYVEAAGGLVPCGQCFHCRVNKKLKRKSRLLLEARMADRGRTAFVTLTYDQAHLPLEVVHPKTGEIYASSTGTLDPFFLQRFVKRLRSNFFRRTGRTLRFAACGEYGDKGARPHYHFIFFGADKRDLGPSSRTDLGPIYDCWRETGKYSPLLCDPSRIDIQDPQSDDHVAAYISDYIIKGTFEDRRRKAGEKYPEFFRSSQGLGRGAVPGLASSFKTDTAFNYIWDRGAIPHTFEIAGKNYLLDSYMRGKILEAFGPALAEEIKKQGRLRYEEEMQRLRAAAEANPQVNYLSRPKDRLAKQFVEEKSSAMIQREHKHALFNPSKKGL